MKLFFLMLTLLIVSPLVAYGDVNQLFSGKVIGVTDGDTIKVLSDGKSVTIRLQGIDSPEKKQSFGSKCKEFTSQLCFQKEVKVFVQGIDRNRRMIGIVSLPNGRCLNTELVASGYAWWFQKYDPQNREYQLLQETAKNKHIGLWSEENPLPPWEFRKAQQKKPDVFVSY